jgi:hypothetical protein
MFDIMINISILFKVDFFFNYEINIFGIFLCRELIQEGVLEWDDRVLVR